MRVSAFLVSAATAFYGLKELLGKQMTIFFSVNDDIEEFKSILENLDGEHADVLAKEVDLDCFIDSLFFFRPTIFTTNLSLRKMLLILRRFSQSRKLLLSRKSSTSHCKQRIV